MRLYLRLLALAISWIVGNAAWAQEPKGWFGAEVVDVTKEEADKLGWAGPRAAKVVRAQPESPAERAGLKTGDIIDLIDGVEVESRTAFDAIIGAKRPGAEVRLRVLSGGRERRVAVTLAERPKARVAEQGTVPQLMLDPGGHMALIKGLAFTPDGTSLISAGDDKVVRIWNLSNGRTVRTIRGDIASGHTGKLFALALSPDGRWLAVAGFLPDRAIRVHEVASGNIVGLGSMPLT